MPATNYNIQIEQGIPYSQEFIVKNADGSNKDLTGYTARMQFRVAYSSESPSLEATSANGKIVLNVGNASCTIELTESDTTLLSYNKYVYDLELVSSSSIPIRLIQGSVLVSPEVTR